MRRQLLVAMAMLVPVLATRSAPSGVSASCAVVPGQTPGGFATAPVVFVGTVVSTSNGDREATVRVESIWHGRDMLTYVRVVGTPEAEVQATSVDRTYEAGKRYLFVPINSSSPFKDNNCTATQLYTPALASQAPADARGPEPGGDPGTPSSVTLLPLIAIGVVVVVVAAGIVVWRRRERR